MDVFIDSDEWAVLEDEETRALVSTINLHLEASRHVGSRDRPPLVLASTLVGTGDPDDGLAVQGAWRRPLTFYPPGWHLYRLACSIETLPDLEAYESPAFVFAVCGPSLQADECELLDWTNAPIYRLNQLLGLDLSTQSVETIREYLIFFCNFLAGAVQAGGASAPFFLPGSLRWFAWDDAVEDLDSLADRLQLQRFPAMADVNAIDPFDLPEPAATPRSTRTLAAPPVAAADQAQRKRRAVEAAMAALPENPTAVALSSASTTGAFPESDGDDNAASAAVAEFKALVWYRDALFVAELRVSKDGGSEMLNDDPIADADPLPLLRWEVRAGPAGLRLLCRQKPRESITAAELQSRIEARPGSTTDAAPRPRRSPRLRGLRVNDRWISSKVFTGHVTLNDVEFQHDVVLNEAVFEHSLSFQGCRFLRSLSAHNTTVKGALHLDECRIDGATEPSFERLQLGSKRPKPALDLRGLKAERGFFADRLTVFGRVRGQHMRVGGAFRARGMQVHLRDWQHDGFCMLDLSHAQIDGPLDLRGHVSKQREPGGHQRSAFAGAVVLTGLHADTLDMGGVLVDGNLDLSFITVPGQISLHVQQLEDSDGRENWRVRVAGALSLSRSKTGLVYINGCWVAGNVDIIELQLSGSLFGALSDRFRTRIGGHFIASGAAVRGAMELNGAWIEGELQFITGRCTRLTARYATWVDPDARPSEPMTRICSAQISGIVLLDVEIDTTLSMAGIELHGRSSEFAHGGVLAHGIRLGGSFAFWMPYTAEMLKRSLMYGAAKADEDAVDRVIAGLSAKVAGSLQLRGISTRGSLDLSHSVIAGEVRLDGARIDGNMRVCMDGDGSSCQAESLRFDTARIGGDADLRGLRLVGGSLSARDAEINGNLLLATPPEPLVAASKTARASSHAVVENGGIDLEGVRAARLVLTSQNVRPIRSGPPRSQLVLSRGKFGQLTVLGFEARGRWRRFPRRMNLLAVQAGDLQVDPDTEALPLLEATHEFDARNYVDVEQRLAKIGKRRLANRVYRKMLWRASSGFVGALFNRLNWAFSANGTMPWLMFGWLVLSMLPVVFIFSNPDNVEFATASSADRTVKPVSDDRPYDLRRDWDWIKAVGLAAGYSLPLLAGTRSDVVRARLVGSTCIEVPAWLPQTLHPEGLLATPNRSLSGHSQSCARVLAVAASPHGIATMLTTIQFVLWLLVAANLPTIARRRA